jgi:NAD-dependent deacetylase
LIQRSHRICVLCGAGLSAESGISTFRGKDGYWKQHRPEDLATPEAFRRDPVLVWQWYRMRLDTVNNCQPNAAHYALIELSRNRLLEIITQNVDGLQQRANEDVHSGSPSALPKVCELHGSLLWAHCSSCAKSYRQADLNQEIPVPKCECGGQLRPSVIWFGESLDIDKLEFAEESAGKADLLISIGTSAQVWPAAGLLDLAIKMDIPLLEINPDKTPFSAVASIHMAEPAAKVLADIVAQIKSQDRVNE